MIVDPDVRALHLDEASLTPLPAGPARSLGHHGP